MDALLRERGLADVEGAFALQGLPSTVDSIANEHLRDDDLGGVHGNETGNGRLEVTGEGSDVSDGRGPQVEAKSG